MRKATIIGIDNYLDQPLAGCVNDARAIAELLAKNEDGSPNFDVNLQTSPDENITERFIRREVDQLFSGRNEIALFYFSGHGVIENANGYLMGRDHDSYVQGVRMNDILETANRSGASNKIIILDCCHSGAFGKPNLSGGNVITLSEGTTVLTASRSSEKALEAGGGGLFTSLLVEALKGGAANLVGAITAGQAYAYIDAALSAHQQRPIFKTNIEQFTSLRYVEPPLDPVVLRRLPDYFAEASTTYDLNPSYEHDSDEPIDENCHKFRDLQAYNSVNLVVPESGDHVPQVEKGHMYYAAIRSRSCSLTELGKHYLRLVIKNRI